MCSPTPKPCHGISLNTLLMQSILTACLAGGAIAAVAWWYMMPGGFPLTHPRFWVNTALPVIAAVVCLFGIVAAVRKQEAVLKCILLAFGTMLVVAAIVGTCLFPKSLSGALLGTVWACAVFALAFVGIMLRALKGRSVAAWAMTMCTLAGVLVGFFLPWSQRAMEPATRPDSHEMLTPSSTSIQSGGGSLSLSDKIVVFPDAGQVRLDLGETTLDVYPLLSFHSRSPDRFRTIFAPRSARVGPRRSLFGLSHGAGSVSLDYEDDGYSRLLVNVADGRKGVRIEAFAHLPDAVYSHLNSFCELHLSGRGDFALSFSPCPNDVAMMPLDYPAGKSARLAYLDDENVFRVAEARSGEKGPFRTLAEGLLKDDEPLRITVMSRKKSVYRITLYDWAKQASRQLSPTAGWGLPENAIEFSLQRGSTGGEGVVFISLAGTSVGRGWDSVGHAAGTYRNAMTIEPILNGRS